MTTTKKQIAYCVWVGLAFIVLFGVMSVRAAQTEPHTTPPVTSTTPVDSEDQKTWAQSAADATGKAAHSAAQTTEKAAHSAAAATDKAIEKAAETTEKVVDSAKEAVDATKEKIATSVDEEQAVTPWLILGGLILLGIVIGMLYHNGCCTKDSHSSR